MNKSSSAAVKRLDALLNALPDLMYIFDRQGTYLEYFVHRKDMLYSDPEGLKGTTMREVLPAGLGDTLCDLVEAAIDTGELQKHEYELPLGDEIRYFESRIVPYGDNEEKALSIVREISEQKKAEAALLDALKEREFLMREMNHRIKNNLILVSSLIGLKCEENSHCGNAGDLLHQIDAIRLVHEKLSVHGKVTEIQLKEYLEDLLSSIFSLAQQNIRIESSFPDMAIPMSFAVSLGLIINELATNAVKHGFTGPEEQENVFSITAGYDPAGSFLTLTISNTGAPFPDAIDILHSESLGLQLITSLVSQLDGTIELMRKPVPLYTLRFPLPGA